MAAPTLDTLFAQHLAEVIATPPDDSVQTGRKVVSSEALKPGTAVMHERGVAVLIDTARSRRCRMCFARQESSADAGDALGQGAGDGAVNDGKGIAGQPTTAACCAGLANLLSAVEGGSVATAAAGIAAKTGVQKDLLDLWLRMIAVAAVDEDSPECAALSAGERQRLGDWRAAVVAHCTELDTSAPSADWMMKVFGAADELWRAVPDDIRARASSVILPATGKSPGGKEGLAGPEALVIIAGQLNRNGYSVRDVLRPNLDVAFGAFPGVAMFNHSCAPNCAVVTCPGGHLEVRTLTEVPRGVELTVSYVDLLLPREKRRAALQATKEFLCACQRCVAPEAFAHEHRLATPFCPRCQSNVPRLRTPLTDPPAYTCWPEDGGCGALVTQAAVDEAMRPVRELLEGVGRAETPGDKALQLQKMLQQAGRVLAPEHEIVIRSRLNLAMMLEYAQPLDMLTMCERQMADALDAMARFLPPLWPEQSEWWTRLGRIRMAMADAVRDGDPRAAEESTRRAVEAYARAAKAIAACAGPRHPLAAKTRQMLAAALPGPAGESTATAAAEQ